MKIDCHTSVRKIDTIAVGGLQRNDLSTSTCFNSVAEAPVPNQVATVVQSLGLRGLRRLGCCVNFLTQCLNCLA